MGAADDLRNALVDQLLAAGAVRTAAVEAALRRVPRHRLLEEIWLPSAEAPWRWDAMERQRVDGLTATPDVLERIYGDVAIITDLSEGLPTSSTSQPTLVAHMLELLQLRPGLRILEIGAGTGYNAALLSEVVGDQALVHTVEINEDVAARTRRLLAEAGYGGIDVVTGDGVFGHAPAAPYDRILATVGCTDFSHRWLDQLAPNGFLLVPLEHGGAHPLTRIQIAGRELTGRVVGQSMFMRIQGDLAGDLAWPRALFPGPEDRQPLPPVLRDFTPTAPFRIPEPGWDFHYYLALTDRRTAGLLTLSDAEGALRVDFQTAELVVSGRAGGLVADLLAHRESWDRLGRPRAGDWRSEFAPVAQDHLADQAPNAIRRVHHLQRVELRW